MTKEGAYVMCRTCLNYSFPFSNIFKELLGEGYVYEVLMDVCQLEVSSEDGLPEYVCFDCHKNIPKFHSFKLKTHEGNAVLHRLKIKHEIKSSDEEEPNNNNFVPYPTMKIEPASSFTSFTPNSGSSSKSTSRTMKECYVRLSRCDQLLQDGYSFKVNIKSEKKDPANVGDTESGNIQGADMHVYIKREKEDPAYLGDNESGSIQGADMQLSVALLCEGDSPSASKDANKEKLKEETLQANTNAVVEVNKVLCTENLFSNGKELEGDDIEIHEEKPYSENASLTCFSPHLHFTENTPKGVGNLTIRNGYHASDGAYIEAEPQEIKETSEDGCVATDSNLQRYEGYTEEILSKLLERSAHPGVEVNLDQSNDKKSLVDVGLKIQEREHLEEMQIECDIFESRNHDCGSSECVDGGGIMGESNNETDKSDNVVSKTYRKIRNLHEDSHVQLRKVKNIELRNIVVCDHCRNEFKEKSELLKHLVGFKSEYTCKRPLKIHKTNKGFVRHDEKHNFKACCSSQFIEKTSIMRESDKFQVKYVNVVTKTFRKRGSFSEESNLQLREEENRDLLDIMVCDYCREEFHEKSDLLKHLVEHSGRSNFGRLSNKTNGKGNIVLFTSDSTKKRGSKKCKRSVRTKNQWKCKWCGKEFVCASALKNHERVHTGEKPFSCKYCSRKFNIKWNLSQHELIHTGIKLHVCTYCSKKFTRKDILRQHELTHTGVKPFSCSYCSKTFNHQSNLNKHERIHTGVKPFSCSYCSKKFIHKSNLKKHERIHTGVKPFSCSYCSKKFNQKSNFKKHELTHTGVRPFSCSYCTKKFNQKNHLNRHELIHTGEKPYMCEYCSKRFRHLASLKVHERIHTRVLSCS